MGAGMPANTGEARAIHCAACFAGMPAPTVITLAFQFCARQLLS
ncbi:diguanylate cyclase [Pseudomonas putida]|nr:diguanylate cyclase [Pseudomonas putida]